MLNEGLEPFLAYEEHPNVRSLDLTQAMINEPIVLVTKNDVNNENDGSADRKKFLAKQLHVG